MKKAVSISLMLLMFAAMLQVSVATHYCSGQYAASKVSLSGNLANCGMESCDSELPLSGTNFTQNCCDDYVTFCEIDSNYSPSFTVVPDSYQNNFQLFCTPAESPVYSSTVIKTIYTNVYPPGVLLSTDVDLSDICILRI